jgi:hypothetical protein
MKASTLQDEEKRDVKKHVWNNAQVAADISFAVCLAPLNLAIVDAKVTMVNLRTPKVVTQVKKHAWKISRGSVQRNSTHGSCHLTNVQRHALKVLDN